MITFEEWILKQFRRKDDIGFVSREFLQWRYFHPNMNFNECFHMEKLGVNAQKAIELAKREYENAAT